MGEVVTFFCNYLVGLIKDTTSPILITRVGSIQTLLWNTRVSATAAITHPPSFALLLNLGELGGREQTGVFIVC